MDNCYWEGGSFTKYLTVFPRSYSVGNFPYFGNHSILEKLGSRVWDNSNSALTTLYEFNAHTYRQKAILTFKLGNFFIIYPRRTRPFQFSDWWTSILMALVFCQPTSTDQRTWLMSLVSQFPRSSGLALRAVISPECRPCPKVQRSYLQEIEGLLPRCWIGKQRRKVDASPNGGGNCKRC